MVTGMPRSEAGARKLVALGVVATQVSAFDAPIVEQTLRRSRAEVDRSTDILTVNPNIKRIWSICIPWGRGSKGLLSITISFLCQHSRASAFGVQCIIPPPSPINLSHSRFTKVGHEPQNVGIYRLGDVICFAPIRVLVFYTAKQNGLRRVFSSRRGGGDGGESNSSKQLF
jgi:hypothetical protein